MNRFIFNSLPVKKLRITSKFGPRNTGIKGASTFHKGIDLGRDFSLLSTEIYSVKAGTVKYNNWNKYRGWYVVIKHDETYETLYQHLKTQCPLKVGTKVKAGDVLGIMGNSSDTSVLKVAVHLHFELHENGNPIDPEPYLNNVEKEIETMTRTELIELIDERIAIALKGAGSVPSSWAKQYIEKAVLDGITDGTRPKGYTTREETVTMIERAMKE